MAISSFPPASTGGGVESLVFDYTTPDNMQIFPFSESSWTAVKVAFHPKNGMSRNNGAKIGFLNAARQSIGSTILITGTNTLVSQYIRNSSEMYSLGSNLLQTVTSSSLTLSGAPAFVVLFAPQAGSFAVDKAEKNTASASNGTLTTITASNASYNLATASWVAVIGGGGGGHGSPAYNQSQPGGGSGYIATAFVPAGTYSITIGAGGQGGFNTSNNPGLPGGDSSFVGGAINLLARGGNKTAAGVTQFGTGGSGGGYPGDMSGGHYGGLDGRPGHNRGLNNTDNLSNGSGVSAPAWVPVSVYPAHDSAGGGVYAGGASGAGPLDRGGGGAQPNTGGGGGGGCSNSGSYRNGGDGGSGVVYIWTPPA